MHADACWGLLAAFSPNLRDKIDGIAEFDSITVDPHKIMAVPYGLSALLVRDPAAVRTISTYSDLIMQEDFAFGQVTPFIGTKGWMSLKLWMMMLGRGRAGLVELADHRHEVAQTFAGLVDAHPRLVRLNDLDLAAVVFAYLPAGIEAGNLDDAELDRLNRLNIAIHARMMDEGRWHLHQFTLPDDLGRLRSGAVVHPLRYGEQSRGHRDLYARRPCLPRQPRTRSGGRNSMTNKTFRAVYESAGVYDELLLRHYYGGTEDVDLVADWLTEHHRAPTASFEVVEFGCGTGRITETIAPYARNLVLADYSETMVSAVAQKFPAAQTICADTSDAVTTLLREGRSKSFDLVTAFWSLSYPIGEFFEELSPTGVRPRQDQVHAHTQAREFVLDLVRLVAPGGHLLAMLFDAESPEQQLVTRGWEAVAPFPVGGRAYTRNVLVDALRDAEEQGIGALTHTRLGGVAWASSREAAREWFFGVHFKHHPQLLDDPELAISVEEFIDRYEIAGGVALPSGVHFVDFHAAAHPYASLPIGLSS
ncbi:pyridoxal-dependent decarboxylase [Nocardia sp. NPDC059195]|uniref:pyridoxal-dependent decarboxylase n=1 Tax=Nocardia sp. NPDC059195 TaxID=3346765 RepID=UPI0036CD19F0